MVGVTTAVFMSASAFAQNASPATGHWQGEIQIPDRVTNITVDLGRNAAGAWIGSMTVTGTTSVDVPLTGITVSESAVRFSAKLPTDTNFQGTVAADGKSLNGNVANIQGAVPFFLTRSGEANVKVPPPSSQLVRSFEGTWNGTIQVPGGGAPIRLILKMSAAPDGTALATLINVDQGNQELPLTTVITDGNRLQMDTRLISGTYSGTLGADGTITGEWGQGGAKVPLAFRKAN